MKVNIRIHRGSRKECVVGVTILKPGHTPDILGSWSWLLAFVLRPEFCKLHIGSGRRWQDGSSISSALNSTSWQLWRGRVTCQTDINIFQHNLPLFFSICPLLKCIIWLERFEETQSSKQWCHGACAEVASGQLAHRHYLFCNKTAATCCLCSAAACSGGRVVLQRCSGPPSAAASPVTRLQLLQ